MSLAEDYARSMLGDNFDEVLRVSDAIKNHGASVPRVSDVDKVKSELEENVSVGRMKRARAVLSNVQKEWASASSRHESTGDSALSGLESLGSLGSLGGLSGLSGLSDLGGLAGGGAFKSLRNAFSSDAGMSSEAKRIQSIDKELSGDVSDYTRKRLADEKTKLQEKLASSAQKKLSEAHNESESYEYAALVYILGLDSASEGVSRELRATVSGAERENA